MSRTWNSLSGSIAGIKIIDVCTRKADAVFYASHILMEYIRDVGWLEVLVEKKKPGQVADSFFFPASCWMLRHCKELSTVIIFDCHILSKLSVRETPTAFLCAFIC